MKKILLVLSLGLGYLAVSSANAHASNVHPRAAVVVAHNDHHAHHHKKWHRHHHHNRHHHRHVNRRHAH